MALGGVTHEGQALSVWGLGGSKVGATASGVTRAEEGTRWTEGNAAAWYFIPEIDPTPFAITGVGTFRGLPGAITGAGVPGFSLVTPMVVTADLPTSSKNVRAVATLRIDFGAKPVPIGGTGILAVLLVIAGVARLRFTRLAATERLAAQLAAPMTIGVEPVPHQNLICGGIGGRRPVATHLASGAR